MVILVIIIVTLIATILLSTTLLSSSLSLSLIINTLLLLLLSFRSLRRAGAESAAGRMVRLARTPDPVITHVCFLLYIYYVYIYIYIYVNIHTYIYIYIYIYTHMFVCRGSCSCSCCFHRTSERKLSTEICHTDLHQPISVIWHLKSGLNLLGAGVSLDVQEKPPIRLASRVLAMQAYTHRHAEATAIFGQTAEHARCATVRRHRCSTRNISDWGSQIPEPLHMFPSKCLLKVHSNSMKPYPSVLTHIPVTWGRWLFFLSREISMRFPTVFRQPLIDWTSEWVSDGSADRLSGCLTDLTDWMTSWLAGRPTGWLARPPTNQDVLALRCRQRL